MSSPLLPNPPWAQPPEGTWTLLEIKQGVEVAKYDLSKACTTLGRAADVVDIALSHESCSRIHARIAFDSHSNCWLKDWQSAHGTCVNKKRVPKEASGRTESASTAKGVRGVQIYPDSMLQFGASTRLYCLTGPEEFLKHNIELKRKLESQVGVSSSSSSDPLQRQQQPIEEDTTMPPRPDALDLDGPAPETHVSAWERLKALKYKLDNIRLESERIRAKVDLSDGQQRQLERNDARLVALQEQFDEQHEQLMNQLYPDSEDIKNGRSNRQRASASREFYAEDDVDDRTNNEQRDGILDLNSDEGESEKSLLQKWEQLQQQAQQLQLSIQDSSTKIRRLETELSHVDSDEAFFVQNNLSLAKEERNKLERRLENIESGQAQIKKLLKVVNPKHNLDSLSKKNDSETTSNTETNKAMLPPVLPGKSVSGNQTFSMAPPPLPMSKSNPMKSEETHVDGADDTNANGSIKSSATTTSDNPVPTVSGSGSQTTMDADRCADRLEASLPPPSKRQRNIGPQRPVAATATTTTIAGTLQYLNDTSSTSRPPSTKHAPPGTASGKNSDNKTDVWQAPKDQDGSGRTKLNDKFAGRY